MSNEEVKEEFEKAPEEVEEVSKEVAEEVEQKDEPKFTDIKKLKCNYTTYKNERTNLKMPITTKCQNCGKKFENGDELYSAYKINGDIKQNYLICKKCAKEL